MNKLALSLALLTLANVSAATCRPSSNDASLSLMDVDAVAPDSRYELQNSDTEVLDKASGLVWQRCSVGQSYNATTSACDGPGSTFTWILAVEQATGQWRLPNIKELASLAARECINPAINDTLFPNAPSSIFWSSSPNATSVFNAWAVNFSAGNTTATFKSVRRHVRLVKTAP